LAPSPVRVVDLRCGTGQTDLNHATVTEIGRVLDVSTPIAQRVVEKRPHYALDDLLVVEGIGRGRLDKIDRSIFCATPITVDGLIPAIPETACAVGQVDAAIAPRSVLMAPRASGGLGLSGPVADRLLARRTEHPFPTLEHLTIVEGIGDGRLKQWVRDGVLCVTPAPFIATTTAGDVYKASVVRGDLYSGHQLEPCLVLVFVGPPQASGVRASGTYQFHLGFFIEVRERTQAVELTKVGGLVSVAGMYSRPRRPGCASGATSR
jgi:hypothetical protein